MMHNHGPREGEGLDCNEISLPGGFRVGTCLLTEWLAEYENAHPSRSPFDRRDTMAHTGHGHHIPNTTLGTIQEVPKNVARCGGVNICPRCKMEVAELNALLVGEDTDYQEKAKRLVKDYVDSLHKQNFPMTELPTYTVYVVWFAKTLKNWKAVLGTTMSDGKLFELTHNGEDKVTYFDAYLKTDNVPIHDPK